MMKKNVIWVWGLVFVAVFALPAWADQSIGYRTYYAEGVRAFKDHDDQKALRCFKIAAIYDPTDDKTKRYLDILAQRGVVLELPPSLVPPDETIGYKYYFSGGVEAFQKNNYEKAIRYFKIALIFDPASREAERYLRILGQKHGLSRSIENRPLPESNKMNLYREENLALAALGNEISGIISTESTQTFVPVPSTPGEMVPVASTQPANVPQAIVPSRSYIPSVNPQTINTTSLFARVPPAPIIAQQQSYPVPGSPQTVTVLPQPLIYVGAQPTQGPAAIISLAQLSSNGQVKPRLKIEFKSSVIIEGRNIQRFLAVDEGILRVKILDANRLEVDAERIGSTFLHIWDDMGRHTLYIEVVFPKSVTAASLQAMNEVRHAQPFRVTYTSDWSTYYSGKNISDLKRQSSDFNQTLAVSGETPYGFFDTSGSYTDFDSISQFDTYTIGLSQIPLDGTSNLNLRGFDALRYLSPLTMPATRMRGAFADVDLMDGTLGLSVSHGQVQEPLGFISMGENEFNSAYVDAVKLTLFPTSDSDRYSFNFATGYGSDRQPYLSNHVYSVQGQHKFNDFLTLSAEEASDSSHDSTLASLRWLDGGFHTGLNFRDIDKDYATVSTLPANQGETGASWVTDANFKNFTASSFVEAYQDHLFSNPDDPRALNYDADGNLRADITQNVWSDSDFNYVDTPGELSPRRSLQLNQRISRSIGVWNSLRATVFGGVGYQNSHSSDSNISDYDREDVIAGIQLPLTNQVSTFANYEYDWLNQPDSGGHSNPNVINAGLEYVKQFNPKFSINSQLVYRDELGVSASNNSFLSGEESVIITSGFAYNPTPDVSFFADGDVSKVLFHTSSPSYDDFEVHLGVRITFGGATYWDPLGTVSGMVFKDINGDGKYVAGDEGVAGVKVKVGDKFAITDKYGRFSIQIRAKGVTVYPVLDTIPGGLLFSTPQSLNVEIIQGRVSRADFGLISQTGIYGIVFVDKNGTQVPADNDQFIAKVKVILDGKIIQKSDSHGAFYFRKVTPGAHTISLDINTLALDLVPLIKLENKIDVTDGTNYNFNIPLQLKKLNSQDDQ